VRRGGGDSEIRKTLLYKGIPESEEGSAITLIERGKTLHPLERDQMGKKKEKRGHVRETWLACCENDFNGRGAV